MPVTLRVVIRGAGGRGARAALRVRAAARSRSAPRRVLAGTAERAAPVATVAAGHRVGVRCRDEGLRYLDRHVNDCRDDGDGDAHGRYRPRPVQPAPSAVRAVPACRRRHEVLADHVQLRRQPVQDAQRAVGQAQAQPDPGSLDPRHRQRTRAPQPALNPLQAVGTRLQLPGRSMQRAPDRVPGVWPGMAHASRSSIVRSVAMALAVWLFTAPLLICIVSAICASDISP